ncbi:hypothetical protein EB821_03920 [Candidatus Marinimicrobia bacterium PRS2]|jgi:hypothetical protein|nr:hypothetical protein EB821_03920 [Candidatus Marinimicrobia bacterium PRS2]
MITAEIMGAWLVVLLTLCIFSFLYKDNPFYKAAEHLYVGVSAGYVAVISFWQQIQPNLFGRLWPKLEDTGEVSVLKSVWYSVYEILNFISTGFGTLERSIFPEGGIKGYDEIRLMYLIPFILGIFMLLRLVPKLGWLARWAIAYIVGMAAGLRFYGFLNSDILMQIQSVAIDFTADWGSIINAIILFIGTMTGLIYFFYSTEHKGVVGRLSRIGIYFLMIKFGASFGFAVMGRISLLIGRMNQLKDYSAAEYNYATPIILVFIIISLAIWSFMDGGNKNESTA